MSIFKAKGQKMNLRTHNLCALYNGERVNIVDKNKLLGTFS
jgi:hypothetical protein